MAPPAASTRRATATRRTPSPGKATDGDPSTSWTTDTYKSAEFGGLKKGVGLLLDLGGEHDVSSVQVKLGADGGAVELRDVDGDKLGKVLATADDASGTVTLEPDAAGRTSSAGRLVHLAAAGATAATGPWSTR